MSPKARPDSGFTLFEILVVIVLMSLLTTFAIPSIRTSLYSDELKATARRLIGLVTEVSQDAVSSQSEYELNFDLDDGRVWATSKTGQGSQLNGKRTKELEMPESVRVVDVQSFHKGKSAEGTPRIYFSTKGYVDRTAIHLRSDDGRDMTIVLSPFLGTKKIFDSYVELDDDLVRY